jgi:hypothetical protein
MMTNEALSWAGYLAQLPSAVPSGNLPYSPALQVSSTLKNKAKTTHIAMETGAENSSVQLSAIMSLRKLLKQRSDLSQVTVNDLLLLYRGLHALLYIPSTSLQQSLDKLTSSRQHDGWQIHQIIQEEFARVRGKNPAMLIPLDASRYAPHERIFPTTFRNPLIDFYTYHTKSLNALHTYRTASTGSREAKFQKFHQAQLTYLRLIGGFGALLTRYRNIALAGQSTSTASIRILGNMPPAIQKLLDNIPGRFDVLNEIIKGEEVFSNMGHVSKGSSLRRFITAKDDNEQKTFAWGAITDDKNTLHISLRDFRPHVAVLYQLGLADVAQHITQDYLDTYANGLNQYVAELREIVTASRETLMNMPQVGEQTE